MNFISELDLFGIIWWGGTISIVCLMVAAIIYSLVKAAKDKAYNDSQPRNQVAARIVSRREQLSGGGETRIRTTHFCTFELANNIRLELKVPEESFGLMVEGDNGTLDYQGNRFFTFSRQ